MAIHTVETVEALRAAVRAWRSAGLRVGFVPTMGNLHAGHFALVDEARRHADRVVASVFVNPTQFGPNEDFARYPRTLDADRAGLAARGCDLLYAPGVDAMYPGGTEGHVEVRVPGVSDELCGASRPGHFTGVATVVAKLFGQVQPDVAVFGQKDFQQVLVVRRMTRDLALPVEIVTLPTVRDADGLALSSRNQYLDATERARAGNLYATLLRMREAVRGGEPREAIEAAAREQLAARGFRPDYAVIRRADDLGLPDPARPVARVALAAAWLGKARLIDNVLID